MELSVVERLVLLGVLPKEGNFTTLKLVRELREELSFNEEEHKKLCFVHDGDHVRWNELESVKKSIRIGDKMKGIIVDTLKKLDETSKLRNEHLTLYEKFVEVENG